MNNFCNDSIIVELRDLTTRENVSANELLSVCSKVKNVVFDIVGKNENLPDSLRYVMHLRSDLLCSRELRAKKK